MMDVVVTKVNVNTSTLFGDEGGLWVAPNKVEINATICGAGLAIEVGMSLSVGNVRQDDCGVPDYERTVRELLMQVVGGE